MMDITKLVLLLHASLLLSVHVADVLSFNQPQKNGNASVRCIESERLSLLALKQGFADHQGSLSSWGSSENKKECCKWRGIWCNHQRGHVVKLDLHRLDLQRTLVPSLAKLHYLKYLDLSHNSFNLTEFPKFITSLTHVKYMDLSFLNFKGKIPNELGHLSLLQVLCLNSNQLQGGVPKSLDLCRLQVLDLSSNHLSGGLDDVVESFRCANNSLKLLSLSGNQIVGSVPDLSEFSSLETLELDRNQLNGALPSSIGQLSSLKYLFIGNNHLEGVVSETHFLRLSKLNELDLSFNHLVFNVSGQWVPPFQAQTLLFASCKLGPTFPTWLQSQLNCSSLDISNADISDAIPSWFWDLPLGKLNLSHNKIAGNVPNFPVVPYSTLEMDLGSNLFEGPIPPNLSKLVTLDLSNNRFTDATDLLCPNETVLLTFLDLSNNDLFGTLPDCWKYFEYLIFFSVANNSLFGEIPDSMGSLRHIRALHFANNKFVGKIPYTLKNCTLLKTFDVAQNTFSGLFPSWIGDALKMLHVLVLRSNMFFGSLPTNICHLPRVQILDLSMNNISGSVPKCLNNLSALANKTNSDADIRYSAYDNEFYDPNGVIVFGLLFDDFLEDSTSLVWKGKEAKYQSILGLVKSIDLSNNMFIGEIPSEMMGLIGLVSLNLSRNKFKGEIPASIGQLESLDFLDLSRNHLFGKIPSELAHIDRLSVMDLSYNNLCGEIPHGTQLQSFDESSYAGNLNLCGAPLPKCLTKQARYGNDDENDESLEDDDDQIFRQGLYISLAMGFISGFWGVCCLLAFKKSWRHAYFRFWSDAYDKVYVIVVINTAKLRTWIGSAST